MTVVGTLRLQGRPAWAPAARSVRLLGLGSATPQLSWTQERMREQLAGLWGLAGEPLDRWHRIIDGSGVERRFGVLPPEQVLGLTTGDRMAAYEQHAPPLATAAGAAVLRRTAMSAERVTDLVVVSCTGFSAPGIDVELVRRLGLRPSVRRTVIGFMGCFGAITGLRSAVAMAAAERDAVVLVVCVELCSLHLRDDHSAQNQVASALFGDGAAAALVSASERPGAAGGHGRLTTGRCLLLPEGRDRMTWRITDCGFAMTLSREVPAALRRSVASFARGGDRPPRAYVVHPGGPAILDAIDAALGLDGGRGIEVSRSVLRRCGNMSSATTLFALDEALQREHAPPLRLLAFGPGLTIESLDILP